MTALTLSVPSASEFGNFLLTPGVKDVADFASAACEWASKISPSFAHPTVRQDLDQISGGVNLIKVPHNTCVFLDQLFREKKVDVTSGTAVICSGADSTLFLQARGIIHIGAKLIGAVHGVFWSSLLFLSGKEFYQKLGEIDHHQKQAEAATSSTHAAHYRRLADISKLEVVKNTALVGMAIIALTSLIFGNLVQGVLFLPTLFLGLSTIQVTLSIFLYFAKRQAEAAMLPSTSTKI